MTAFLILYVLFGAILVVRSKYKILCNELFYLGMFWALILGVYLSSGVVFRRYGLSIELVLFVFCCATALLVGRKNGKLSKVKVFSDSAKQISTVNFAILGLLGVLLFVYDLYRLNGIMIFIHDAPGKNNGFNISILGALGSLLVPILLVEGLYLYSTKLKYENSFSLIGFLLLIGYTVPCILNNGRESLAYVLVSMIAIYGYVQITKTTEKRKIDFKKLVYRLMLALGAVFFVWMLFNISSDRFGQNEINTFLVRREISADKIKEAESWGELEFLYYNIASYFSHQISFLDFTIKEYEGPYLYGMFELNIISRRLPDFLNLDYRSVFQSFEKLYSTKSVSYSGAWNTVLGSFICDFGRIGTIFVCYFLGLVLGKIRRKFEYNYDIRYAVLIAIICASSFSTIQLGPFFNPLVYGSYIWWMVIFMRNEKNVLPKIR